MESDIEATPLPPTSPKRLSLRRNFSWTLVGNVIYAGSQWGMLMVLAKLGSPEMVGQFSLGLAIATPIFMLTNLQLRAVQATDAREEYQFGQYVGLRLSSTVLALLITGVVLLISHQPGPTTLIIALITLSKAFESLSDVIYGRLQQYERMDRIAQSMMIKGPMSLLALGLGTWLTGELFWGVAAFAVVMLIRLLTYDAASLELVTEAAPHRSRLVLLQPLFARDVLFRLAWLALPLGMVQMLISLSTNIPRYYINHFQSTSDLGIFSALLYIKVAAWTVFSALSQSASPRLARYFADDNPRAYWRLLLKMLVLGVVFGVVAVLLAVLAGRQILTVVYTPEYAQHHDVLVWIMVAAGLNCLSTFLSFGATATRTFKVFIPPHLIVVIITTLLAAWLIPTYGLRGGAWTLCGTMIVNSIASTYLILRAWRGKRALAVRGPEEPKSVVEP